MSKLSGCLSAVLVMLLIGGYLLFIRPVSPEIYFAYRTQFFRYDGGKIEFYLVNRNPENGGDSYFFKIGVDVVPKLVETCKLSDFNWELKRKVDDVLLFSTESKSGLLNPESYFENKIHGSVFKGMNGSELGEYDFVIVLTFDADNGCGIEPNTLIITKTMRLRYKKQTLWDVMMSV